MSHESPLQNLATSNGQTNVSIVEQKTIAAPWATSGTVRGHEREPISDFFLELSDRPFALRIADVNLKSMKQCWRQTDEDLSLLEEERNSALFGGTLYIHICYSCQIFFDLGHLYGVVPYE
ncbi:unnamed protein product, partial [Allacma fusca]